MAVGACLTEHAYHASMGPQLDSCGWYVRLGTAHYHRAASMGPQLDSCGWCFMGGLGGVMLQWGRNLTVADGVLT